MSQAWKKQNSSMKPGTIIKGKWHKHRYVIRKKLGQGAVGEVYLCVDESNKQYALKISRDSTSMTLEVNVLKSLEKVQGHRLGPSLLDVDDWEMPGQGKYAFYVMELLEGISLDQFIKRYGSEWVGVLLLQLLDDLERLHQAGWVFGDLKIENLIVLLYPPKIRLMDVGGTTYRGRSIKEYTEFYDRGYWGMGSRKAEPSYDLFALVMVFLTIYYPKRFEKGTDPKGTLMKKLNHVKPLHPYKSPLRKALMGHYHTSAQMRRDVLRAINRRKRDYKADSRVSDGRSYNSPLVEGVSIFLLAFGYYISSVFLL